MRKPRDKGTRMDFEIFRTWVPFVLSALIGMVTLGALPKCGDFQTRVQAQTEHAVIEGKISAVKDSLTDTKIEVIKEIHKMKEDLLKAMPRDRVERGGDR